MTWEYTRHVPIIVCGVEWLVDADFTVESYGSSGNGWDDDGDPAELTVTRVMHGERDITQLCLDSLDTWGSGPGFAIYHSGPLSHTPTKPYCKITFNNDRTLMEAIEEDIHYNLHEYQYDPWDGYDDWRE